MNEEETNKLKQQLREARIKLKANSELIESLDYSRVDALAIYANYNAIILRFKTSHDEMQRTIDSCNESRDSLIGLVKEQGKIIENQRADIVNYLEKLNDLLDSKGKLIDELSSTRKKYEDLNIELSKQLDKPNKTKFGFIN